MHEELSIAKALLQRTTSKLRNWQPVDSRVQIATPDFYSGAEGGAGVALLITGQQDPASVKCYADKLRIAADINWKMWWSGRHAGYLIVRCCPSLE